MAPLWFSSYVLQLRVPDVSLTAENIADFISAYIIGNLLQMAFRFWAFRRWVFPDEFGREPRTRRVESTLTAGGIAEAMEDVHEPRTIRLWCRAQLLQRHPAAARAARSAPAGRPAVGLLAPEGVEDFVIQQRVDALHLRNVVELQRVL